MIFVEWKEQHTVRKHLLHFQLDSDGLMKIWNQDYKALFDYVVNIPPYYVWNIVYKSTVTDVAKVQKFLSYIWQIYH
jgi:hypothetical protein